MGTEANSSNCLNPGVCAPFLLKVLKHCDQKRYIGGGVGKVKTTVTLSKKKKKKKKTVKYPNTFAQLCDYDPRINLM